MFRLVASDDDTNRMPPLGEARLPPAEIELLRQWILAGALEFPPDVAPAASAAVSVPTEDLAGEVIFKTILEHVRSLPAEERPFYRYFSSRHLLTGGATRQELDVHQAALAKAINHLSKMPEIVKPQPLDAPTCTIFAIDLRQLGWDRKPFRQSAQANNELNLFDLLLLEYPYASVVTDADSFRALTAEFLVPARVARPIPYLRIDWFVSNATQSPLYEDMLQLPFDLQTLERSLQVDAEANVKGNVARRAGLAISGVSRNVRVVERHQLALGAYWKSFDFSNNTAAQDIFRDPIDLHPAGGEMIFTLPNGLQGYFITDATGRRIAAAPTSIVTDRLAQDATVRNGLSCIRCHDQGMKRFVDVIRPLAATLPPEVGFSPRRVLELYAARPEMDKLLAGDQQRFLQAIDKLGPQFVGEPITPVSRRFLDSPLHLNAASAELGLASPAGLTQVFRTPRFVGLGMSPLTAGNVIRRDSWEAEYGRIVRELGLAVPIIPFDGITHQRLAPLAETPRLVLASNKPSNVFSPGDELQISVRNESAVEVFVELIGTSTFGRKVLLTPTTVRLKSQATHRFPESGSWKVGADLGAERITLFASDREFPVGVVLRGESVADRVFHDFYSPPAKSGSGAAFDPSRMLKQELEIETRGQP